MIKKLEEVNFNITLDDYISNYLIYDSYLYNIFLNLYSSKNKDKSFLNNEYEEKINDIFLKKFFSSEENNNFWKNPTLVIWDIQSMSWILKYVEIIKTYNIKNILYYDDKDINLVNPFFKNITGLESPIENIIYILKEILKEDWIDYQDINFYKSSLKSSNTKENSIAIQKWIEEYNLNKNIIYPTKSFHSLRSLLTLKKIIPDWNINIVPVDIFLQINWKLEKIDFNFFKKEKFKAEEEKIISFLKNEMIRIFAYQEKWDLVNF